MSPPRTALTPGTDGDRRDATPRSVFPENGVVRELGGNTPLLLDDPGSVWMVTEGSVDVFFVHLEEGRIQGARTYCASVHPGEIFFVPVPLTRFGLLAVSAGVSRLLRVNLVEFLARANDPGNVPELARMLDLWIGKLVEGSISDELKYTDLVVEPGFEQLIDSDVSVRAHDRVVWIRVPADQGVYMDRKILGLDGDPVWIPVSGRAWVWITATESFTLRALSTEALLERPDFLRWLQDFHAVFFSCARQRVLVCDADERERLKRLEGNERLARREAVARMRSVLTRESGFAAEEASRADIVAACSLVGQALGIVVKAPPDPDFESLPSRAQVCQVARASGIRVREVALEFGWWRRDHGPLLGFLAGSGRPVALLPRSPSRYVVVDPRGGARTEVTAATVAALDGRAFVLYRPLAAHIASARELVTFAFHGCGRDLFLLGLLGFLGASLGLLTPILTGLVFDTVIPHVERSLLFQVAAGLAAIAVGGICFEVTKAMALLRIVTKANHAVECGVWDRLLKLPVEFFRRFQAGDLALRANGYSEIATLVKGPAFVVVLSALFSTVNLALMFHYSVPLAMVGLVMIVLAAVFVWFVCRSLGGSVRRVYDIMGDLEGMVFQLMTGIGKLRGAGAETRAFGRWARMFSEQMRAHYAARRSSIAQSIFSTAYPGICILVLFLTLGRLMDDSGALSIGGFLAFNAAFGSLLVAVLAMSVSLVSFVAVVFIHERALPILKTPLEVDEVRAHAGRLNGRIEINQVSFRYHRDGPLVLDGVSLHVRPGEFLAIVGPSGSGKSTLLRLLLGFETPDLGSIFYDGQELSRLHLQSVRRQIGVVLQTGSILPGSIFENIVGDRPLSMEDAWQAARVAGIEEDIRDLPMGMHTRIMEGIGGISGGQKQRLMIARAVAGNPRILFFDEATSALDNRTQEAVSRSIERLRATRVVVAHRLSTVIHADRIVVMAGGRKVQEGTYRDLASRDGPFKDLIVRQIV